MDTEYNKWVIGIDVGGTNIKAGLVNSGGQIRNFIKMPTAQEKSPQAVLNQIASIINRIKQQKHEEKIIGIGLALPGTVDCRSGECKYCPNLGWSGFNVSSVLKERSGFFVKLINDADAACWGEYLYGVKRGTANMFCLTLGTGVGSGVILNHKLFVGEGTGVEAGHMRMAENGIICSCGGKGCWETLVSARALLRRTEEIMPKECYLEELRRQNEGRLTTNIIFQAYGQGDETAVRVVQETRNYLARGLVNLINLFNIGTIIIGGGLSLAGRPLIENLEEQLRKEAYPTLREHIDVSISQLGNKGGVLGAAGLWHKENYK